MLVAAVPPQAKLRQPRAQPSPSFRFLSGNRKPQCPVGKTDLKAVNQLVAVQAPPRQIGAGRRRLFQPFVVVSDNLAEQASRRPPRRPTGRAEAARCFALSTVARRTRPSRPGRALQRRGGRKAVVVLHELDDVARLAARHAMPQSLVR